jgi:hypothetical protein
MADGGRVLCHCRVVYRTWVVDEYIQCSVVAMTTADEYKLKQFSVGDFTLPAFIRTILKPRQEKIVKLIKGDETEREELTLKLSDARPYVGMYAVKSAAATSLYRVGGRQYETGLLYALLQYGDGLLVYNGKEVEFDETDYTKAVFYNRSNPKHIIWCAWFGANVLADELVKGEYYLEAFDKRMDKAGVEFPVVWGRAAKSETWKQDEVIPDFLFVHKDDIARDKEENPFPLNVIALETKLTYTVETESYGLDKLWHPAKQLFRYYSQVGYDKGSFQIWLSTCVCTVPKTQLGTKSGFISTLKFNKEQSLLLALWCVVHYVLTNNSVAFDFQKPDVTPIPPATFRRTQVRTALNIFETYLAKYNGVFTTKIKAYRTQVGLELPDPPEEVIELPLEVTFTPEEAAAPWDVDSDPRPEKLKFDDASPYNNHKTGQPQIFNDYV